MARRERVELDDQFRGVVMDEYFSPEPDEIAAVIPNGDKAPKARPAARRPKAG